MAILDANDIMFRAFEPKVQNRFVLNIDTIPAFMVKNVKAPTFTDNVVKLDHINSYRKIRGKREWDDITMVLYDPITPSGAQAVMEWVRLHAESVTGRMGYAAGYKKKVDLFMLDPTGAIVENWELRGTFLTNVNFGDLDYSGDDLADVSATLRFDRAILKY
mgnify:CR=1 FL=1